MQVHIKCKQFLVIDFLSYMSIIAAKWEDAILLIILACANRGFTLRAIRNHAESITQISFL